jgi:SAM-dependent methyltransferase
MRKTTSLSRDYFEQLYRDNPDPWKFETSEYERAKYDATIRALGAERSQCALEVGCGIGVLIDVSHIALRQAHTRCSDLPQISFMLAGLPDDPINGMFDLIVLSEVVYYWDAGDSDRAAAMFMAQHQPAGRLLLVHWLGETDYPASGDQAVQRLQRSLGAAIRVERASRTPQYRLDLWRWVDRV